MSKGLFTTNVMFWFNITLAILLCSFENTLQATMFLVLAGVFFAAELVIKELRDLKND